MKKNKSISADKLILTADILNAIFCVILGGFFATLFAYFFGKRILGLKISFILLGVLSLLAIVAGVSCYATVEVSERKLWRKN
mgnify:CR=1 FL=1